MNAVCWVLSITTGFEDMLPMIPSFRRGISGLFAQRDIPVGQGLRDSSLHFVSFGMTGLCLCDALVRGILQKAGITMGLMKRMPACAGMSN